MNADRIRKQVYELLPIDLESFPIWEHALDEEGVPSQDEATVRIHPDLDVADPGGDCSSSGPNSSPRTEPVSRGTCTPRPRTCSV
jgi:hypothetical protein